MRRSINSAKFLYFQQNPGVGACEEYFQILIKGVGKDWPDGRIYLLCPKESSQDWANSVGSCAEVLPISGNLFDISKQFLRIKPDLFHINDPSVKALSVARMWDSPRTVLTYHTPSLDIRYNWKGSLLWRYSKRNPDLHLIALSESNKNLLINRYKFSEEQIEIIPYGLDDRKFRVEEDAKMVREEMGLADDSFLMICAARLAPQKAHKILLEAFRVVLNQNDGKTDLLLLGDGKLRSELEAYANEFNIAKFVHFLGHRKDIYRFLNAANLVVLSSHFEGMPFALLEAMAMGKPIVATDVVGIKDCLENNRTALLVPSQDSKRLAEAVLKLVNDRNLSSRLGNSARHEFMTHYTSEIMIGKTMRLYEKLLENQSCSSPR